MFLFQERDILKPHRETVHMSIFFDFIREGIEKKMRTQEGYGKNGYLSSFICFIIENSTIGINPPNFKILILKTNSHSFTLTHVSPLAFIV